MKRTRVKVWIKQLWLRIRVAFFVLIGRKRHFFICSITEDNLRRMIIADKPGDQNYSEVEIEFTYHRLQPYNVFKMVEIMYEQNDKIDMALLKANLEAEAELLGNNNE